MHLTLRLNKKHIIPALCILDVMLLPYIRFLSCSISMLVLLVIYVLDAKHTISNRDLMMLLITVAASLFVGIVVFKSTAGINSAAILVFSFMLLYYIKPWLYKESIRSFLQKLLMVYLFVAMVLALIYTFMPGVYFSIRSFWTMSATEIEFVDRIINRYTFIYSDPNNAGCMFIAIMAYLLLFTKRNLWMTIYCIVVPTICVISTFSVTAVAMLLAVYALLIVANLRQKKKIQYVLIVALILVLVMFFVVISGVLMPLIEGEMVQSLLTRIELNQRTGTSLGGRSDYWEETIEKAVEWYNIFVGKGAVIDALGNVYTPHSGHLFLLVSFGFLSNILVYKNMCWIDRRARWIDYIPMLPILAILTINTGISDYRFMTMYALIFSAIQVDVRMRRARK